MERSQLLDAVKRLKRGDEMTALLAPSFVGQFPGSPLQTVEALRQIGFSRIYDVRPVRTGQQKKEAAKYLERCTGGQNVMGISYCPAYVEVVCKHAPDFSPMVSATPTLMAYTAADARQADPNSCTVFIGPCIAKKQEALSNAVADAFDGVNAEQV